MCDRRDAVGYDEKDGEMSSFNRKMCKAFLHDRERWSEVERWSGREVCRLGDFGGIEGY